VAPGEVQAGANAKAVLPCRDAWRIAPAPTPSPDLGSQRISRLRSLWRTAHTSSLTQKQRRQAIKPAASIPYCASGFTIQSSASVSLPSPGPHPKRRRRSMNPRGGDLGDAPLRSCLRPRCRATGDDSPVSPGPRPRSPGRVNSTIEPAVNFSRSRSSRRVLPNRKSRATPCPSAGPWCRCSARLSRRNPAAFHSRIGSDR